MASLLLRRRTATGLQRVCNDPSMIRWFSAEHHNGKSDKYDSDNEQKIDFGT